MIDRFARDAWEQHWREAQRDGSADADAPNPYLDDETLGLPPGTALDAGCGTGADAVRLAASGWAVTGVDIAPSALNAAARRAGRAAVPVTWIEADLTTWEPSIPFDLVTTAYAHASIPQLRLYHRIAEWVAPGGTLLIVGHGAQPAGSADDHGPPEGSTATTADITGLLEAAGWRIRTAREGTSAVPGHPVRHHDVVVRAERPVA
ncbi:trans-aconitate 2-methyltransferase [Amnibacterium sp.]|uniref:class I SAM-dependent methyltransferase n=1 Tax=Amnibacterium sp. TaxID=1872496 RepID=UPI002601FE46|nr:class I SAM-dependent methyltransferase [Amnibacterium sp.]MCU1473312.1 SAM-dependent methyltransferase [Amnibacterium sp.]